VGLVGREGGKDGARSQHLRAEVFHTYTLTSCLYAPIFEL